MEIAVLGAGIAGITTAYYLVRAGHRVRVLESKSGCALGCSYGNGGQFSYSYTEPLASPALLPRLPGLLLKPSAPLRIGVRALPGLGDWGWRFLRNCTPSRLERNTRNLLRLSLYSRRMLHELEGAEHLAFDYRRTGKLHLYFSEAALEKAGALVELKRRGGCEQQVLDPAACLEREPALAHLASRLRGGVFSPLDESGDSLAFSRALAGICVASGQAAFHYGCEILSLRVRDHRLVAVETNQGAFGADAFVVCLGAHSAAVCRPLGLRLPIQPGKGYSVTLPAGPGVPRVNITDTESKLVYSLLGERLRIVGMMEFVGFDRSGEAPRLRQLLRRARETFPNAADYDQRMDGWSGFRPLTPDGAPLLGATPYRNLYLNTGHGMLGSTLACGSAAVVADLVSGRTAAIELHGLTLTRFV